jgi:superfamily II DNA or RNA helicase
MNYKFKTKPYAHQITALEKSWNKEAFAYFMEMGTGKSKVLIDNISMLYDKGKD